MSSGSNRSAHWLAIGLLVTALAVSGLQRFHVRAFGSFILILLALVAGVLALIVLRYRPGDVVTREPFEDALLPHGGRGGSGDNDAEQ